MINNGRYKMKNIKIISNKSKNIKDFANNYFKRLNEIFNQINDNLQDLTVKKIMTSNPISVDQDILAEKALSIMNTKKITTLCVHNKKNTKKTIGIIHIHNILDGAIS